MGKRNPKSAILEELRAATQSEQGAVEFLERHRWGAEPCCPHCGDLEAYAMQGRGGGRNKDFRWRCRGCKRMFTVRTGTMFEETRLPLRIWVYAFWKACSSKKGISALQLAREMEITHKSALYVLRRIRHGLGGEDRKLSGTVEVDETYVGGKRHRWEPDNKAPVVAMAERDGDVRFFALDRITVDTLEEAIAENIDLSSRLMSDESFAYRRIGRRFKGGHGYVKHSAGEYKRPGTDIHSNSVEGVFSLLKRGIMGTFHSVSKKHLPNYLNEFEFRHNSRKVDDGERVSLAIRFAQGRRLTYRESVDNPPYNRPGRR